MGGSIRGTGGNKRTLARLEFVYEHPAKRVTRVDSQVVCKMLVSNGAGQVRVSLVSAAKLLEHKEEVFLAEKLVRFKARKAAQEGPGRRALERNVHTGFVNQLERNVHMSQDVGGMVMAKPDDGDPKAPTSDRSLPHVLSQQPDFLKEITALEEKLRPRGHILKMCVKCHPELAGVGIEYTWGKSKVHFRRNNDCIARHLYANVIASLTKANIPLSTIRKYARKTRSYLRAYMHPDVTPHAKVEALVEVFKAHRCALDFDFKFIRDT